MKARIPFELYKGIYDENQRTINGVPFDIFANVGVEAIILDNLFTDFEDKAREDESDV